MSAINQAALSALEILISLFWSQSCLEASVTVVLLSSFVSVSALGTLLLVALMWH